MRAIGACAVLAVVVAACSAATLSPAPASSPSGSPVMTSAPTAASSAASAGPTPPCGKCLAPSLAPSLGPKPSLALDDVVRVLADAGLQVRSKPSVDADSVKYEPLLGQGALLRIIEGPVAGSGYWWYRVHLLNGAAVEGGRTEGWVAAAARDGSAWIGTGEGDFGGFALDVGWPTVSRGRVTLAGELMSGQPDQDGAIDLAVKATGLYPGSQLQLAAHGVYSIRWACSVSGRDGTDDAVGGQTAGTVATKGQTIAADDGTAGLRLDLVPDRPALSCPTDHPDLVARSGEWTDIWVSDPSDGVQLTPPPHAW